MSDTTHEDPPRPDGFHRDGHDDRGRNGAQNREGVPTTSESITNPGTADAPAQGAAPGVGLVELIEQATSLVRAAAAVDPRDAGSAALVDVPAMVEQLSGAVEALRSRVLPVVEADQLWALRGHRSFTSFLTDATGMSGYRARRETTQARTIRDHLPDLPAALAEGSIGTDHAAHLARTVASTEQRAAALQDPEMGLGFLLRWAREMSADNYRRLLAQWAVSMDPEAADRAWRNDSHKQTLTLAQTLGGWHLDGWLTHETGLTLRTALDAATGRPPAGDARTRGQRDADALASLATFALGHGAHGKSARLRPHLLITIPHATAAAYEQLTASGSTDTDGAEAGTAAPTGPGANPGAGAATGANPDLGADLDIAEVVDLDVPESVIPASPDPARLTGYAPATFSDGTPLAPGQLAHHLCSSTVTRVIMNATSEPLDVGRAKRIFTEAQTKAVIARDKHCQYPGCSAPPSWCEVHHLLGWSHGGTTSIDNAILLCWSHHHEIHRLGLRIEKHPDHWHYINRHGTTHATTPRTTPTLPLGPRPWARTAPRSRPPTRGTRPRPGTPAPRRQCESARVGCRCHVGCSWRVGAA